jgi:hypothetical protein
LAFCVAENRPAMAFCIHGLPQTIANAIAMSPRVIRY